MIWILIALIFSIAIGIWLYKMDDDFLIKILLWIALMVGSVAFAYIAILISSAVICNKGTNYIYEKTDTTEIVALSDSTGVNGRVGFLGSGYISEDLYYYYMKNTSKGYRTSKIRADATYVRYSEDPHIETYSVTGFKNKLYYLIGVPFANHYYIAYIPEGSIMEIYNIDLK